jgi:shikimate kinase
MEPTRTNLVLIGMPGSGKSTVGVILAKRTSLEFVDTDLLIQASQRRTLQKIVDSEGYLALRTIEEDILLHLSVRHHVIATGGSAVYSDPAMAHLKSDGVLIFLDLDLDTLESRVHDLRTRGLAKRPDQSFSELYAERCVLYAKHADITIQCHGLTQEQVCERIVDRVGHKALGR